MLSGILSWLLTVGLIQRVPYVLKCSQNVTLTEREWYNVPGSRKGPFTRGKWISRTGSHADELPRLVVLCREAVRLRMTLHPLNDTVGGSFRIWLIGVGSHHLAVYQAIYPCCAQQDINNIILAMQNSPPKHLSNFMVVVANISRLAQLTAHIPVESITRRALPKHPWKP